MEAKKVVLDPPYLDEEERGIIESLYEAYDDQQELTEEALEQRKKELAQTAKNTIKARRKPVGIRLNESDVDEIKERAKKLGMPYQTLISAVLHQYAEGTLFLTDTVEAKSLGIERQTKDLNRPQ